MGRVDVSSVAGKTIMKKKIVYVINHAAFFVSHRLPLAIAAREAGWEVHLLIGQPGSELMEPLAEAELKRQGLPYSRLSFRAVGFNPIWELIGMLQLLWHIARMKPSIVHTASPKAGLYGGLVSRLLRVPCLVVAISGMGFLFTGHMSGLKGMLKRLYSALLAWVCGHPNVTVIVQNQDDKQTLLQSGTARPSDVILIPGSGVNLSNYALARTSESQRLIVLPARLLRNKGVEEFVTAAKMIKEKGSDWRFALIGTADYANPSSIPETQIKVWADSGVVEWWGHREDMPIVYAQADIVCLPSYREGMPKCLLEAAAAGCAVVTSDVIGCREAIIPGETGDLVPAREAAALASALHALISDPDRCQRYGKAGRALAIARFGIEAVLETTLNTYDKLLVRTPLR